MYSKPVIFVVISILVVVLIYSSVSASGVFAVPPDDNWGESRGTCETSGDGLTVTCCWRERIPGSILGESYCQTCKKTVTGGGIRIDCDPKELQFREQPPTTGEGVLPQDGVLEQPPTPPPTGPVAPLQDGVLEQLPSEGVIPPLKQGKGVLPRDGVLEQQPADQGAAEPPATEGSQPAIVEEEPVPPCPEGQVLDEESGLCVLEETEAAEEPEPAEELEEQPTEEGSDSSEDNNS